MPPRSELVVDEEPQAITIAETIAINVARIHAPCWRRSTARQRAATPCKEPTIVRMRRLGRLARRSFGRPENTEGDDARSLRTLMMTTGSPALPRYRSG